MQIIYLVRKKSNTNVRKTHVWFRSAKQKEYI